jgi:hypothetical protein
VPVKGKRRVNYFVKHLMVDEVGDFSKERCRRDVESHGVGWLQNMAQE